MAAVPVLLRGTLYDLHNKTSQQVLLDAEISLKNYEVGGGPITPPPGEKPPGIWGPNDPRPQPPINFPPDWIGGVPPVKPPEPPTGPPPQVTLPAVGVPVQGYLVYIENWGYVFVPASAVPAPPEG